MRKTNTAWRTVKANKTVNFLSNGGTPAPVQQVVAMGGNVSEIEISHEYYTFDGWYTDSVYTEIDKWTLASDKVTSNLNLYAKWYIDVDQELFDPGTYVLRYDGKFVLKEEVEPEDVFKAKEIHIDTLQLVGGGCGGGGAGSGGYDWGQD
ncbi:MAG: InlB B-repeat-containing protein, partial [Treponema sp.]|nr:InlB B-repeat-containing protein [Treponema sp.]